MGARLARQQMPRAAHAELALDQRRQRGCKTLAMEGLGGQSNKKAENKQECWGNARLEVYFVFLFGGNEMAVARDWQLLVHVSPTYISAAERQRYPGANAATARGAAPDRARCATRRERR